MTRRSGPYAPGYDLFKLIVAVILTIILIALMLSERVLPPAPALLATQTLAVVGALAGATETVVRPLLPTATQTVRPVTVIVELSPTSIPATTTPLPTASPKQTPDNDTPTATPLPPVATEPGPTPDPLLGRGGDADQCPSTPSRIAVGDNLRVLVRLNFRTGPGLNSPIILTNKPGTLMKVIGGPTCTPLSDPGDIPRAYLWWNVRMEDGQEGWSAEGSLTSLYYFLQPFTQ